MVKRSRSSSLAAATAPQRVPAPPALTSTLAIKPPARVPRPNTNSRRASSFRPDLVLALKDNDDYKVDEDMDIEAPKKPTSAEFPPDDGEVNQVEQTVAVDHRHPDLHPDYRPRTPARSPSPVTSPVRLGSSPGRSPESAEISWPAPPSPRTRAELQRIKETFTDDLENLEDEITLVTEYSEEIYDYMSRLEEESMPGKRYIDGQTEITWEMRQTLVDWLLQLHLRYGLLPETLFIAVNIVDRFLTKRVVSLVKLQLVGVTAMFIAAKYEEILAPRSAMLFMQNSSGLTFFAAWRSSFS